MRYKINPMIASSLPVCCLSACGSPAQADTADRKPYTIPHRGTNKNQVKNIISIEKTYILYIIQVWYLSLIQIRAIKIKKNME